MILSILPNAKKVLLIRALKEYKVEASSLTESVISMVLVDDGLMVIKSVLSSLLTNAALVAFF